MTFTITPSLWIGIDPRVNSGPRCWGVCRSMSSLARAKTEVAGWRLLEPFRPDGVSGSSGLSAGGHVHYVNLPIDRLPGHTCHEHPNILQCLLRGWSNTAHHPFTHPLLAVPGKPPAL
jgi:hypothetical protein